MVRWHVAGVNKKMEEVEHGSMDRWRGAGRHSANVKPAGDRR